MKNEVMVSERFGVLAEEFNEHDRQAGVSFVAMLNVQEEAKLEYQERTGKVHGFNEAWSEQTGKAYRTICEYNRLAKLTVELRKNDKHLSFSGLTANVLMAYASASPEAQEVVAELLEEGQTVSPKEIKELDKPVSYEEESAFEHEDDDCEVENLDDYSALESRFKNHVYDTKDLFTLAVNTVGAGMVTSMILENTEITVDQFHGVLLKHLTELDGVKRSAAVYTEYVHGVKSFAYLLHEACKRIPDQPQLQAV